MLFAGLEQLVVLLVATLVFAHPGLGKLAALDVLERLFHTLLHTGVDDFRANLDITPLGRLGDRETHSADAGLVDQINNQFQLVKALEVGHLRLVTSLDQHLVPGLDK